MPVVPGFGVQVPVMQGVVRRPVLLGARRAGRDPVQGVLPLCANMQ